MFVSSIFLIRNARPTHDSLGEAELWRGAKPF
jgi:hypothetical protein